MTEVIFLECASADDEVYAVPMPVQIGGLVNGVSATAILLLASDFGRYPETVPSSTWRRGRAATFLHVERNECRGRL